MRVADLIWQTEAWASLVAQWERTHLLMQETQAQSLGPEDPPGEGNGNPSSILAWENPLDRGGLQSTGLQKSRTQLSH